MYHDHKIAILSFVTAVVSLFIKSGNTMLGFIIIIISLMLFGYYLYLIKHRKKNIDLSSHPFWGRMEYYSKYKLPYLKIEDPIRKKVFFRAMRIHLTIAVKEVRKVIDEDFQPCTAVSLVNHIIDGYEKEWRNLSIPESFIAKFRYFHKPRIKYISSYLSFICTSNFYHSDIEKKVALLDGMLHLFQWTILDIERTNNAINGALDKELKKMHMAGFI